MVQWLGLQASNAGDAGSIPGRGTKIPHATQRGKTTTTTTGDMEETRENDVPQGGGHGKQQYQSGGSQETTGRRESLGCGLYWGFYKEGKAGQNEQLRTG